DGGHVAALGDDLVDQAVLFGRNGRQPEVAIDVLLYVFWLLASVLGDNRVVEQLKTVDLSGDDLEVAGLTHGPHRRLVKEKARRRGAKALALVAAEVDHHAGGGTQSHNDCANWASDEAHGVIDCEAGVGAAA